MKNLKQILSFILACLFCLGSLLACSDGDGSADTTVAPDSGDLPGVEETVIYVDASAEAGGDGSKDSPLKSVADAQQKIREIKNSEDGLPAGGITVLFASGEYQVMDGINFTEEDSGTEECPITYMAAEKYGATFTGGFSLSVSDFVPLSEEEKALINDDTAKDKILKIDLSKYGLTSEMLGKMYSHGACSSNYKGIGSSELFINNERMTVSRYPNKSADDPNLRTGSGDEVTEFQLLAMFEFEKPAIAIKERGVNWDVDNLWVHGQFLYGWAAATVPVKSFDIEELKVTLAHEVNYGIGLVKPFYFFNIFAETDEPGEYYIDRENVILYVYPTEDFENSSVVLSVLSQNIITAIGVSNLTFKDINVTATRTNGLVLIGNNVTIDSCKFFDIRGDAINVNGTNITVKNSEIYNIGDGAVIVDGGNGETVTGSNNLVYNNYIHHWGQIGRTSKYAIYLDGCGATASHNEIHDAPHQAVLWVGPNHTIEYNEVYNVCLETDDCGALYSGRSFNVYGSIIRYNYIHDIGRAGTDSQAIYLDDGLSGQTVYGNVINNVSGFGIQVGGGRDNVIENNLIINSGRNPIEYDSRARDGMLDGEGHWFYEHTVEMPSLLMQLQKRQEWLDAFPVYGDIIPYTTDYTDDPDDPMLSCNPGKSSVRMNISFRTDDGKHRDFGFASALKEMSIVENNLKFDDLDHVQLPGIEKGDCTLADDAEAYKSGFERIPFGDIGRIK